MAPEKPISHTLKNQHIKYVPKQRLSFIHETPDGRMALIYKSAQTSKYNMWDAALAMAIPAMLANNFLPQIDPMIDTFALFFLPAVSMYSLYDKQRRNTMQKMNVDEIFLYENGHQLLVKTKDSVLHKIDIIYND